MRETKKNLLPLFFFSLMSAFLCSYSVAKLSTHHVLSDLCPLGSKTKAFLMLSEITAFHSVDVHVHIFVKAARMFCTIKLEYGICHLMNDESPLPFFFVSISDHYVYYIGGIPNHMRSQEQIKVNLIMLKNGIGQKYLFSFYHM